VNVISEINIKIIAFFSCFLLLTTTFNYYYVNGKTNNESDLYGFIIPLPQGKDTTFETLEISKVSHLINDLLRVDIEVYQIKKDFKALCKSIKSEKYEDLLFSKGAFFIPFSGDIFTDALIISIIYDYNESHELNIIDHFKSDFYILIEKLDIECDQLIEPIIVQHFGKSVRYGWPTYLEIADSGGFYNFDFLLDNEAFQHLNNNDYNVYIWPYLPDPATYFEQVKTLFNVKETNAIRKFVYNGGGFIGTCYGAYAASSGFIIPGIFNSLRLAYNPSESRILPGSSLSISDSLMTVNFRVFKELIQVTHKIVKPEHQLFYGVNGTTSDFFISPIFIWTGKNTEILTVFDDFKTFLGDPINNSYTERILTGKPGFINSKFGNGEVVLFSSHPDFVNNITPLFSGDIKWEGDRYYGRRVIFNSFFYATSKKNTKPDFSFVSNETFINLVINKTKDLQINNESTNQFNEIINDMDSLFIKFTNLNNTLTRIKGLFTIFLDKSKLFPNNYIFSYSSLLTGILNKYINSTRSSLNKLDKLIPMISRYNDSILNDVEMLKTDMKLRIQKANELADNVIIVAQQIEDILESDNINVIQKIDLLNERRDLLSNFGIELKYIPQLFFDSEKVMRNFWYNYEAYRALN
jgi:hypothetical protein